MCLILVKEKGVKLTDRFYDYITKSWRSNNDGGGFAQRKKNGASIFIKKGIETPDEMINRLDKMKIAKEDELIVHLRMCTHGSNTKDNTHPFIIKNEGEMIAEVGEKTLMEESFIKSIAFFHNGCISAFGSSKIPEEKLWSDTRLYAQYVLAQQAEIKGKKITGAEILYNIKKEQYQTQDSFNKHLAPVMGGYQKFALLSTQYGVLLIGDYYTDTLGFKHSNKSGIGYE